MKISLRKQMVLSLFFIFTFMLLQKTTIDGAEELNKAHPKMEQMMRDCEALNRDLKEMFAQLNKAESMKPEEQAEENKKHREMMKKVLHEMTLHMESEVKMLEMLKSEKLGHEGHHTPS